MYLRTIFLAGEDFVLRTYEVVFPAGSTMEIITIEVVDDNVIEDILEIFTLQLSTTDEFSNKGIQIGPNFMSEVTVMDNDGETFYSNYIHV